MLQFYYNPSYKYTNRSIIDISSDTNYISKNYVNIDSPDTINGHIIYQLETGENLPTYIYDTETARRWFISGITQLRSGKFQMSLLRDIISEGDKLWKTEEAYINAGLATDYNKYKTWDLPYTNTKVREERLNINGRSSFFVYYVNTQNITNNVLTEEDLNIKSTILPRVSQYDYRVSSLSQLPGYEYINAGNVSDWTTTSCEVGASFIDPNSNTLSPNVFEYSNGSFSASSPLPQNPITYSRGTFSVNTSMSSVLNNTNNVKSDLNTAITNWINSYQNSLYPNVLDSIYTLYNNYRDKVIYNTTDQKVYILRGSITNYTHNERLDNSNIGTLMTSIRNINWPILSGYPSGVTFANEFLKFTSERRIFNITLEEIGTALDCDFTFSANQRKLPKSAVRCVNIVPDSTVSETDLAQTLMVLQRNALNVNNDTGKILDVQYLPFSIATTTNANIKINNTPVTAQFLDTDDFFFETDLPDITNINKETDKIKIISPSRASQFVFSPYNNDGSMLFTTSITIKPYSTVIYVRPSTQGLLISDWDDKDCLIINEDFSLTVVNSDWANYVYQNRNYENAFNRQVQGREFERSWERRIEEAQKVSDEWTARNISSQKAVSYTGNIPIISGIAGAIATSVQDEGYLKSAQLDREYNESMYRESVNIARDSFNYQLDNIKSQPGIPSKVTSIDIKFLDGIYLEFYSTNPTELQAIQNFYIYNGNRIDAYGTFAQYYGHFVRGKIIKSQYYTQPEISELNKRLNIGIFTEVL